MFDFSIGDERWKTPYAGGGCRLDGNVERHSLPFEASEGPARRGGFGEFSEKLVAGLLPSLLVLAEIKYMFKEWQICSKYKTS